MAEYEVHVILDAVNNALDAIPHLLPRPVDTNGPNSGDVPDKQDVHIPNELSSGVSRIFGFITWVVFSLAAAGVLFCAVRVAIAYKEGGEVLAPGLLSPLIACIVAVSASGIIGIVVV
ncbi:hypothetical protein LO772_01425 [Yinghuangia sp. ASG 101]|uniref:hypothetical protein n=1 Tax=Yinghuangia sp. ASG 101 TaxID=2896848 RepID=UPI001E305D9D|nr:hypothetical protein [Yinghuangia sp. ASG 101]UGQ12300.1 hypothetical protein LO772_01425 [Yinghuangia sp. ASG 101]